jgi:hypothetical protein
MVSRQQISTQRRVGDGSSQSLRPARTSGDRSPGSSSGTRGVRTAGSNQCCCPVLWKVHPGLRLNRTSREMSQLRP